MATRTLFLSLLSAAAILTASVTASAGKLGFPTKKPSALDKPAVQRPGSPEWRLARGQSIVGPKSNLKVVSHTSPDGRTKTQTALRSNGTVHSSATQIVTKTGISHSSIGPGGGGEHSSHDRATRESIRLRYDGNGASSITRQTYDPTKRITERVDAVTDRRGNSRGTITTADHNTRQVTQRRF